MNMPGGGRPMMNMPAPADKPLSAPSNHDLQQGMLPVPTVANGEPIVRQDAPVPSTNQWYNGPPRPQEEMLPPMIQQAPPQQKMPSPPQQQIPSQQMPQQMVRPFPLPKSAPPAFAPACGVHCWRGGRGALCCINLRCAGWVAAVLLCWWRLLA